MLTLLLSLALTQGWERQGVDTGQGPGECLWWREGTTVELLQNTQTSPDRAQAVHQAIAVWNDAISACSSVRFSEGPTTDSRTIGLAVNAQVPNVVLFREKTCGSVVDTVDLCWALGTCADEFDCFDETRGLLAVTTVVYDVRNGRIDSSGTEFNAGGYPLVTDGSDGGYDVERIAIHEFGHALGLAHAGDAGSVMFATIDLGDVRHDLDPGLAAFVCQMYPPQEPSRSCRVPVVHETLGYTPLQSCSTVDVRWLLGALVLLRRRSATRPLGSE